MDLSRSTAQTSFCFDDPRENNRLTFIRHVLIPGIHKDVAKGDFVKVRRWLESGGSVNKKDPHYNFTPLHVAVIYHNMELVDYLLTRENVEVDVRSSDGKTPLHLATEFGKIQSVEKLIQAGSDVNLSDNNNDTALHKSVSHPDICRLLIQHGARIRTNDSQGRTLHDAVVNGCLELVYMLLYYNVDANAIDEHGRTPFMLALVRGNVEAQKVLLEYVDDLNRISYAPSLKSTLSFSLGTNSPFVKDIMERGADIYYEDDSGFRDVDCVFAFCLYHPVDVSVFKMVWEKLRANVSQHIENLLYFLRLTNTAPLFLQVIIDSDNFKPAVQLFSEGENYFLFVNKFAEKKFHLDQLTILTCRLLEYGFRASSYDIHAIFSHYGYCELFRILLYMDNDFTRGWLPHMALSRLMFDVSYDLKSLAHQVNDIPKDTVLQLLEYSACPRLIDALTIQYSNDESMSAILDKMPRVPSLIELARNVARKHIWQSFKIINTCQFYTTIDHLDISVIYKKVLKFQKKLYRIK